MAQEPWDKGIKDAVAALGRSMDKLRARGWPYGAYGDSLQLLEAIELRLAKAHDGCAGKEGPRRPCNECASSWGG